MVVFARSYSKIITVTSVLMSDMLGRTGMSSVGDRMMYMSVTLAVSATVFEIFTLKDRKLLTLPTPSLFEVSARVEPLRMSGWNLASQKNRIMGLPGGEKNMTLAFFVLTQYRLVTDRRTDGRTDTFRSLMPALAQRREGNKKAQLTLWNPRDVKACKNCSNSTCFVSFHRIPFPRISKFRPRPVIHSLKSGVCQL